MEKVNQLNLRNPKKCVTQPYLVKLSFSCFTHAQRSSGARKRDFSNVESMGLLFSYPTNNIEGLDEILGCSQIFSKNDNFSTESTRLSLFWLNAVTKSKFSKY